jgi:hypothetical protein
MVDLVLVESPFAFKSDNPVLKSIGLFRNVTYARLALHDSFQRGEFPWCSHLIYTQSLVLDDDISEERLLGINAGLAWGAKADISALYLDLGLSKGMEYGIAEALKCKRPIERRWIPGWENALLETPQETLTRLNIAIPDNSDIIAPKY